AISPAGSPTDRETSTVLEGMNAAAATLGVRLHLERVDSSERLEFALAKLKKEGVRVVMPVPHPLFYTNRIQLIRASAKAKLVLMGWTREFADAGAPISFGVSNEDAARLAAGYVARILKGDKPENLPVQNPTRIELVINRKSAKATGYAIPQNV